MKMLHSEMQTPGLASPQVLALLETIREAPLRTWVEQLAIPRHFLVEAKQNQAATEWLRDSFVRLGLVVEIQGPHANVVACPLNPGEDVILVGAHYDSVPLCPGADDNASAVAALLGCATACRQWDPELPVVFVAFNREEEGLVGSRDFVASSLPLAPFRVRCAHILEMVGFTNSVPGSQRVPTGLPIQLGECGDFLGLLADHRSGPPMEQILRIAKTYVPRLGVAGLQVEQGFERVLPVLARSDHVPFWEREIPAVMWTDTAEFRNPHYHQATDTPETLDYGFLRAVTQILTATVVTQAG